MDAASTGDYGPVVFATFCLIIGIVLLLNPGNVVGWFAHEVAERGYGGDARTERTAYLVYRLCGVVAVAMGAGLVFLA